MNILSTEYILSLADKCLEKYDIEDYETAFIRHNENITVKVTDRIDNSKYLLRIHEPVSLNYFGVQHTYEGLNSEMTFLHELNMNTDLILQKPVLNKYGESISTVVDIGRNRTVTCTLLSWVEGDSYNKNAENINDIAFEFGIVLAKLHKFSFSWEVPQPFIRPTYDASKYKYLISRLDYGVDIGLYSKEDFKAIRQCMDYIEEIFNLAKGKMNKWGVIHGDTHTGNIVINSNKVSLIDFSFSGYGYYALDLGIALSSLKSDIRKYLIEGYKTLHEIDEVDYKLINACFLLSIFGAFAFCINKEGEHDWFRRRLPETVNNECKRLLNDEMIIF